MIHMKHLHFSYSFIFNMPRKHFHLYLTYINISSLLSLNLPPGIFAYLNYRVPRTRKEILTILVKGLERLEYRGYDSAGEPAPPSSLNVPAVCNSNRYDSAETEGLFHVLLAARRPKCSISPVAKR